MKLGFTISVYDKFEEANILVDIIKKNLFPDSIVVIVCNFENEQKAMHYINKTLVDKIIFENRVKFNKDFDILNKSISLRLRVMNQISAGINYLLNEEVDYIMHLHSDAWILKRDAILDIIDYMKNNDKKLAIRGYGFGTYRRPQPVGAFDDMYFIVEKDYTKQNKIFEKKWEYFLIHKINMHGILAMLAICNYGIEQTYHYSDLSEIVSFNNKLPRLQCNIAKPMMFDEKRGFLHIHTQSFINKDGFKMQAYFLKKFNIIYGSYINKFLDTYFDDKFYGSFIQKNEQMDSYIKKFFLEPIIFCDEPIKKYNFIKQSSIKKILFSLKYNLKLLFKKILFSLKQYIKYDSNYYDMLDNHELKEMYNNIKYKSLNIKKIQIGN